MKWEDIEKEFDIDIPPDIPVFPMNVVCELLHMQYHVLHEIMKQDLLECERKRVKRKPKKLLSHNDICKLKYIQHLMDKEGVNISGIKIILEMIGDE